MEMPKVTNCSVEDCAYNKGQQCHALAITIGDQTTPNCDTFCPISAGEGGDPQIIAGVGACKTSSCKFNEHLECQAASIMVGRKGNEIDCLTYAT